MSYVVLSFFTSVVTVLQFVKNFCKFVPQKVFFYWFYIINGDEAQDEDEDQDEDRDRESASERNEVEAEAEDDIDAEAGAEDNMARDILREAPPKASIRENALASRKKESSAEDFFIH